MARNNSGFFDRAAWANNAGRTKRPTKRMVTITSVPSTAMRPRLFDAAPPAAPMRNSIGTSARSSNRSIARAARPTGLCVPDIGNTSAVEDIASANASQSALIGGRLATISAPPINAAVSSISAAPIPNTIFRIATRRRKLSSSPIENSKSTMPSSANGLIPSGSEIDTQSSAGYCPVSAPSPNGPAKMPTRMKPITGLILKRAKVGMTMPAAPKMVIASLSAGVI